MLYSWSLSATVTHGFLLLFSRLELVTHCRRFIKLMGKSEFLCFLFLFHFVLLVSSLLTLVPLLAGNEKGRLLGFCRLLLWKPSASQTGRVVPFILLCCCYMVPGSILGLSVCRFFRSTAWITGSVVFLVHNAGIYVYSGRVPFARNVCNIILGLLKELGFVPMRLYGIRLRIQWNNDVFGTWLFRCGVSTFRLWFNYMLVVVAPSRPRTVSPFGFCWKQKLWGSLVVFVCSVQFYKINIFTGIYRCMGYITMCSFANIRWIVN